MPEAISNTSPLLYLYRVSVLEWLPQLFREIWIPPAVEQELQEGRRRGYAMSPTPAITVGFRCSPPVPRPPSGSQNPHHGEGSA